MERKLLFILPLISSHFYVNGLESGNGVKWLTNTMPLVLNEFVPRSKENHLCNSQVELYKLHLSNSSLWAVKMLDANVISPTGVITSSSYNVGAFDQCIKINLPDYNLRGRYCLVGMEFKPNKTIVPDYYTTSSKTYMELNPYESVWMKIKKSNDPRIKYRDTIYWAMCIPSGCTQEDLITSLNKTLVAELDNNGIEGRIFIEPGYCQTSDDVGKWDIPTYIFLSISIFQFSLIVIVTLAHMFGFTKEERRKSDHWILNFSLLTNLGKLSKSQGPKELQFLAGMKVWSMIIIIYGHRLLMSLYKNILNPDEQAERYGQFLETINFNGAMVVNTFLLISGFLSYYKCITEVENGRKINLPLFIIYRYLRVTPVYMFVIWFCALILPLTTGGPFWTGEGLMRSNNCRRNWWTHILYINNYIRTEEECIIPGWYLAVDMQLFIVCTIIGYLTYKHMKIIPFILTFIISLSIIIPGYVIYQGGYDAIIKFYLNYLTTYYKQDDYVNTYTRTHMRAAPYFVGMVTALIYSILIKLNFQFSKVQIFFGAIFATIFSVGTLLLAWVFFIPGLEINVLFKCLYGSLSKVAWSGALGWVIIAEATTGFGTLSNILKNKMYIPLNKLTLCVLIIHTPLQQFLVIKQRLPNYLGYTTIIWMTCGDVLMTYLLALVVYLVIEAPLASSLQMILFKKFYHKK